MVINVADALAAYRKGGNSNSLTGAISNTEESGGASFSDTLKNFAGDALKSLEQGEQAATSAATGKADLASVVTAISNAEVMLQTVVTIRDKVIAAYQDISKTAI